MLSLILLQSYVFVLTSPTLVMIILRQLALKCLFLES